MRSRLLFLLMLFFMVTGFGSQWNCTCFFGDPPKCPECPPPPKSRLGCFQQLPTTYTHDEPRTYEYTVVVGTFGPLQAGRAHKLAAELREKRIYNHVFQEGNGSWVVSVGRFWTEKQAHETVKALQAKKIPIIAVRQPEAVPLTVEEEIQPPGCSCNVN